MGATSTINEEMPKENYWKTLLSSMEVQTILFEVEVILNDLSEQLTPNHLLFGRTLTQKNGPNTAVNETFEEISKRKVRYVEKLVEHFCNRWRTEYVVALRNLSR